MLKRLFLSLFLFLTAIVSPLSPVLAQSCPASWTQVATTGPQARIRHAFSYHEILKKGVLFGGTGVSGGAIQVLGDVWFWDSATKSWQGPLSFSPAPQARYGAAMSYDAARQVIVLHGGNGTDNLPINDTWEFDGVQWRNVTPAVNPSARVFHSLVFDSAANRSITFGGLSGSSLVNDTWVWNGSSWTQVASTGPSPRELYSFVYDAERNQSILFGGFQPANYLGDTWKLEGNTWTQIPVTGPQARIETSFVYDPKAKLSILFGGLTVDGIAHNDTWTFDGGSWQQLGVSGPSARRGANSTYDSRASGLLLFGGTDNVSTVFGDTWTYGPSDVDNDATADCLDQCPGDPLKTVPGACGCGFIETASGCAAAPPVVILSKPPKPSLRMRGKKVRVKMQPLANAEYVISYWKPVPRGSRRKPRIKTVVKTKPTVDVGRLADNTVYVFRYQRRLSGLPSIQSEQSAKRKITVRY